MGRCALVFYRIICPLFIIAYPSSVIVGLGITM
jgi:hypothetical protein